MTSIKNPSNNFPNSDGDKETCACLAAPQCGVGSVCTYDCSCGFPCEDAAEQVVSTLQSIGELTFAGTFDFVENDTEASVACSIKWDTDTEYLVGYTVRCVTLCRWTTLPALMHLHPS